MLRMLPTKEEEEIERLAFAAVRQGNLDALKRLVDERGLSYMTIMELLRAAISSKQTAIVKYIISVGVLKDENRCPVFYPLQQAIYNQALDIVEALLEAGFPATGGHNTSIRHNRWMMPGDTPLHCAIRHCGPEIARMLLKHGADPNEFAENFGNATPPLFEAVAANSPDLVTILLDAGAKINFTTEEGFTALNRAFVCQNWDALSVLLRYKPDVDNDALVKEIGFRNIDNIDKALELFAENGISFSVLEGDNDNTMFKAIRDGNIQVLKESLENYDLTKQSVGRRITPLHIAAYYKQAEVAELLINRGADPLALDSREATPIRYLMMNNTLSMLTTFLTTQKCKDVALINAVTDNLPEFVEFLLQRGANVFIIGRTSHEKGYKPLQAMSRSLECIQLFLEYGGDPNAYDTNAGMKLSLLYYACFNGEYKTLDLLLNYGADINAIHYQGETVFVSVARQVLEERLRAFDEDFAFFEVSCEAILRHIEKLNALDLHISTDNREMYKQLRSHEIRNSKFEEEVALMKEEKLDCKSSLYDVMRASDNKLARFAGNEQLMGKVLSGGYSDLLPSFNSFIIGKLKVGKIRRKFLERGCESMLSLFPNLPFLCIQNIVKRLTMEDLNTLSM